jgi:hypothetical protein
MCNLPLDYTLQNSFYLPPQHIKLCDKYYILYWESRYLYTALLSHNRVVREQVSYTPIFQDGITRESLGLNPEEQIKLSFRRLKGKIYGYVIVSKIRKNTEGQVIA